jgi:hypothetical protein
MFTSSVFLILLLVGFVARGQFKVPPGDAPGIQPGRFRPGHRVIEPIGAAVCRL